jgi:NitT/TauT family transport system substrate-binding protein
MRAYGFRYCLGCLVLLAVACAPPVASPQPTPLVAPPAPETPVLAAPAPAPPTGAHVVKIGLGSASASNAGVYVADGLGFFGEQGLQINYVDFGSASEVMPALARGDLEIGDVGINPALFNAVARKFGIKLVADKGSMPPGFGFTSFVVATSLADQIKGAADLKARKLAMTPPGLGTANGFVLDKYLTQAGLTTNDLDIVPIAFPEQIAALANHSVDAAIMAEPFATRAVQNGVGVRVATLDQIDPYQQVAGLVYSDAFINQHRDLGIAWMTAYVKGIRAYNAALSTGVDKERIISILADKTDIKDKQLWASMIPAGLNGNGKLNEQSIADAGKYFQSTGLTPEVPPVSAYLDNSFTDAAVAALGPAPTPAPAH